MTSATPQDHALRALHEEYIGAANAAVADGDDDLVDRLDDEYTDEALRVMRNTPAA